MGSSNQNLNNQQSQENEQSNSQSPWKNLKELIDKNPLITIIIIAIAAFGMGWGSRHALEEFTKYNKLKKLERLKAELVILTRVIEKSSNNNNQYDEILLKNLQLLLELKIFQEIDPEALKRGVDQVTSKNIEQSTESTIIVRKFIRETLEKENINVDQKIQQLTSILKQDTNNPVMDKLREKLNNDEINNDNLAQKLPVFLVQWGLFKIDIAYTQACKPKAIEIQNYLTQELGEGVFIVRFRQPHPDDSDLFTQPGNDNDSVDKNNIFYNNSIN
ncbi:MAG: hypothetical protein WBM62_23790 [Crocosphaera sp.]|jgi:hypothetical protein